jgi:hypothetical protein
MGAAIPVNNGSCKCGESFNAEDAEAARW